MFGLFVGSIKNNQTVKTHHNVQFMTLPAGDISVPHGQLQFSSNTQKRADESKLCNSNVYFTHG